MNARPPALRSYKNGAAIAFIAATIGVVSTWGLTAIAKDTKLEEKQMITTVVRFALPAGTTREAAKGLYENSASTYQKVPGLIRKYYLYTEDGPVGGGIYLWESRQAAERLYTSEWRKGIAQRLGAEPEVLYFETPVLIDNLTHEVIAN